MYFHTKLKILERRQQRIREVKAKHEFLKEELEETKCRLMMDPNKWKEDCKYFAKPAVWSACNKFSACEQSHGKS